jgi:hypothetical protein
MARLAQLKPAMARQKIQPIMEKKEEYDFAIAQGKRRNGERKIHKQPRLRTRLALRKTQSRFITFILK